MNWTEAIAAICATEPILKPVDARTEYERSRMIKEWWQTPLGKFNYSFLMMVFAVRRKLGRLR